MAAAGVDASNTPEGTVLLLPVDPDASARVALRAGLSAAFGVRIGVVITDTAGRPWRQGVTDIAIGAAGLVVLDDLRGQVDTFGRPLVMTQAAVADEIASAGELVKGKAEGRPLAVVRGLGHLVTDEDGPGARALVRLGAEDMFAQGSAEAYSQGWKDALREPAVAFAAALAACLVARTSLIDVGSVTSAIERRAPGSPYAPAASAQPAGCTPRCLPRSARKIRAFWSPKPGSALSRLSTVGAVGVAVGPQPRDVAVVLLDESGGDALDAARHRAGVAVHGGRGGAHRGEGLRVGLRDPVDVEAAHPVGDLGGTRERGLHRVLLVQEHADEQGERVVGQELVGGRVAGEPESHDGILSRAGEDAAVRWVVVVPVKPAADGKTRLAGVLSASAREALVRAMALDTIAAAVDDPRRGPRGRGDGGRAAADAAGRVGGPRRRARRRAERCRSVRGSSERRGSTPASPSCSVTCPRCGPTTSRTR